MITGGVVGGIIASLLGIYSHYYKKQQSKNLGNDFNSTYSIFISQLFDDQQFKDEIKENNEIQEDIFENILKIINSDLPYNYKFNEFTKLITEKSDVEQMHNALNNNAHFVVFSRIEQFHILNHLFGIFDEQKNGWLFFEIIKKSKNHEIFIIKKFINGNPLLKQINFKLGTKEIKFDTSLEESIKVISNSNSYMQQ